jgi:hypothetical protein
MIIEGPDDDDDASSVLGIESDTDGIQEKWRRAQKQGPDNASHKASRLKWTFNGRLFKCRTPVAIYMEQKKTLALETK